MREMQPEELLSTMGELAKDADENGYNFVASLLRDTARRSHIWFTGDTTPPATAELTEFAKRGSTPLPITRDNRDTYTRLVDAVDTLRDEAESFGDFVAGDVLRRAVA